MITNGNILYLVTFKCFLTGAYCLPHTFNALTQYISYFKCLVYNVFRFKKNNLQILGGAAPLRPVLTDRHWYRERKRKVRHRADSEYYCSVHVIFIQYFTIVFLFMYSYISLISHSDRLLLVYGYAPTTEFCILGLNIQNSIVQLY